MRPVLPQLAFLLTLRRDLPNGGSTHHSTDLLAGWPPLHSAALFQGIGLLSSAGGISNPSQRLVPALLIGTLLMVTIGVVL